MGNTTGNTIEIKPFIYPLEKQEELLVPKVFDVSKRRRYMDRLLQLMKVSNVDYHNLAKKLVFLFDHEYLVYPNLNLQIKMASGCGCKCDFCIEGDGDCSKKVSSKHISDSELVQQMEYVLAEFSANGIFPSCSITGGEPTEYPTRLKAVINTLKVVGVKKFNLNTNGFGIDQSMGEFFQDAELPYINLSLHHWEGGTNREIYKNPKGFSMSHVAEIMKYVGGGTYGKMPRVRLQCVLLDGAIDSMAKIEEYLERAIDIGIDNVAFRGLSNLPDYKLSGVKYTDMLDRLSDSSNPDWQFVCQNVADWYLYEDYRYKGVDVHFSYSDMMILQRHQTEEIMFGNHYGREFVIFEDGGFAGSWNRDLSEILPRIS